MKIPLQNNFRQGFALIIVMLAIFVLAAMAAVLSYSMKIEMKLAMTADHDEKMVWMGRSGAELARWVLAQESQIPGEPYDSLNQLWAGGPGGPGETNSVLSGISLTDYPLGEGTVSLKIIDLERFVNVNVAPAPILQQTLTLMGVDADQISVVSDSIQDWVQPGDSPRVAGAKNDYYQSLNPSYNCKEAPIDDLSELLLVRGIFDHPEIFYGGSPTNIPPSPFHHQLGFGHSPGQAPDYPFGLKEVFTPFSSGLININTADKNVLQIILASAGMDIDSAGDAADQIIKYRAGPDGVVGTDDDMPFQNVGQIAAAGINTAVADRIARYCTVRSYVFKATITARIGQNTRDFNAILYRQGRNISIVNFYWNQ